MADRDAPRHPRVVETPGSEAPGLFDGADAETKTEAPPGPRRLVLICAGCRATLVAEVDRRVPFADAAVMLREHAAQDEQWTYTGDDVDLCPACTTAPETGT